LSILLYTVGFSWLHKPYLGIGYWLLSLISRFTAFKLIARTMRMSLEKKSLMDAKGKSLTFLSASFGMAQIKNYDTQNSLLSRVNKAMYQAK